MKDINISNFKTDNVTNMSSMFYFCYNLQLIDLSNFNTNNVQDMSMMFACCFNLKELDVSNFNTNNVTDMDGMFMGCFKLQKLNVSNFNTSNVTTMDGMFLNCFNLQNIDVSNFNIHSVESMQKMFMNCKKWNGNAPEWWKKIDSKSIKCNNVFTGCKSLLNYNDIPIEWKQENENWEKESEEDYWSNKNNIEELIQQMNIKQNI